MWLKLAAQFSDGPGVQLLPCLSQSPRALRFCSVSGEKEEMGPFPSIFGAGFHPFCLSLLTAESPPLTPHLNQPPGTYGKLHSSYLFLWLGVALCPQVKGLAVRGAEGRGQGSSVSLQ